MAQDKQPGSPETGKTGGKRNRGFAAMDQAQQREIASRGGRAAHEQGTAHEFTSEEARAAGRKGGQAAHQSGNAHEFTSEEARAAGRKGGQASQGNRARLQQGEQSAKQSPLQQQAERGNTDNLQQAGGPARARHAQADDGADSEDAEFGADVGADGAPDPDSRR